MRSATAVLLACALSLPATATESNPSIRQRQLSRELLELMDIDATIGSVIDTMFGQIQTHLIASAGPDDEEEGKELFEAFRARSAKIDFTGLLEEGYIRIYSKYFSERELADLIVFYKTPTGRKSITVMSDLMRDGMQLGAEQLAPKIDEVMAEVMSEHEKKRPWRGTMADMRTIAVALEAYATDHDAYPLGDFASLKAVLEPTYIRELPKTDVWGHDYAYVVSSDRTRYRIVSAGGDSIFEWDSRRITDEESPDELRISQKLEDDLIFADGMFVQVSAQAEPREDSQPF
jgi:uncharacterized protein